MSKIELASQGENKYNERICSAIVLVFYIGNCCNRSGMQTQAAGPAFLVSGKKEVEAAYGKSITGWNQFEQRRRL